MYGFEAEQIANEHYQYFLLYFHQQVAGYLGIQLLENRLHLSKLYILSNYRGQKIGKAALELVDQLAHTNQCQTIDLYVNRHNEDTIKIYQKTGYTIEALVPHTYDNGHVEEDYKMVKALP